MRKVQRMVFCMGILVTMAFQVSAQVTISNMFTSGMVLQQNTMVNIWGWANPGDTVAVSGSWNNQINKAIAGNDRKWVVQLQTPLAKTDGKSFTLTIKGSNTITLNNILIGEVWLLSGQSNMEMPLEGWTGAPVEGSTQAIAEASYPNIRLLIVGKKSLATPLANIEKNWILGSWTACSPATVRTFSAAGYFFGKELYSKLNIPIGLVMSAWGGSSCETWANPASLSLVSDYKNKGPWSPSKTDDNQTPTVLYNGMIAPVVPFTFAGVLWYQGETNVGRAQQLTELFPAMIEGWRNDFRQKDLPFYFVQLCPWGGYGGTSLPELWEAQSYTQLLKNTGMVGTLDLGDVSNIHPAKKEPVGHRLALLALAKKYGQQDVVYSGPQFKSMKTEGTKIRIEFNFTGTGLKAENNSPAQFEVAGDDLAFFPAQTLIDGHTLLVWNDQITAPKHVRYAWSGTATATLFNNEGLPATPFRTNTPNYLQPVKANLQIGSKTITSGETCTIEWTTFGAKEVSLNGEVLATNGTMQLQPEVTTDYTFVAKGEDLTITRNFTIYVNSGIQMAYPNGLPFTIPGSINVTHFDQGGEGISYHDLTMINGGDGIRQEQGVDTEFRLPEGTIGGIQTSEWLEYTIDAAEDGIYTFDILFATSGRYGKFHLEFDGIDRTGQLSVPISGSYSKFMTKTITGISLRKGIQVMRIYFDYAEYNLGTITVSSEFPLLVSSAGNKKSTVFPSPASEKLYISDSGRYSKFSILNLEGRIIKQGRISDNQPLDIQLLTEGNYLIRLENGYMAETRKFVKL